MFRETYRSEYVRCGKANCRSCPHGPYWYAYWKQNGKTRKRYIGKVDPDPEGPPGPEKACHHRHDDILSDRTASLELACEILGVQPGVSHADARARARALMAMHHPDRGGEQKVYVRISAAWSYLRVKKGWS